MALRLPEMFRRQERTANIGYAVLVVGVGILLILRALGWEFNAWLYALPLILAFGWTGLWRVRLVRLAVLAARHDSALCERCAYPLASDRGDQTCSECGRRVNAEECRVRWHAARSETVLERRFFRWFTGRRHGGGGGP